jgi:hypothetical protein
MQKTSAGKFHGAPSLNGRQGTATYSILMFIGSIQAHAAYLDGAGPFLDFTRDEFLQIIP